MELTQAHKSVFFNSGFHLPKLIAKSSHAIANGEDFLYSDKPALTGLNISSHELKDKSDAELFDAMQLLFWYTSTGRRKEIANDMIAKFRSKTGGEYRNPALNEEVSWNNNFKIFAQRCANRLAVLLKETKGDIGKIIPEGLQMFAFNDLYDRVSGFGIMIHQVWSGKVEVVEYTFTPANGRYKGVLKFTLYDHFGLDRNDVIQAQNRYLQPFGSEWGFQAWWILQHYRGYKPFVTVVEIPLEFYHTINS